MAEMLAIASFLTFTPSVPGMSPPLLSMGRAAPMFVPGDMNDRFAARVMNVPALAARPPAGVTHTITGTGDSRKVLVICDIEASPIDSSGGDIPGTLGVKVKNDAIANISAIAQARGRPVAWAASTVSDAKSYSASEAVAAGAVDGIAATEADVLAAANGRTVTVAGGRQVTLALSGAVSEVVELSRV